MGEELCRRPLNRDSFAQIVAAAYYSFHSPKSSDAIPTRAKAVIARWIEYLPPRSYRTHSKYREEFDEFERDGDKFKHLYSDGEGKHRISYLDKLSFRLMPHEIAALRRCGDKMGLDTRSIALLTELGISRAFHPGSPCRRLNGIHGEEGAQQRAGCLQRGGVRDG